MVKLGCASLDRAILNFWDNTNSLPLELYINPWLFLPYPFKFLVYTLEQYSTSSVCFSFATTNQKHQKTIKNCIPPGFSFFTISAITASSCCQYWILHWSKEIGCGFLYSTYLVRINRPKFDSFFTHYGGDAIFIQELVPMSTRGRRLAETKWKE